MAVQQITENQVSQNPLTTEPIGALIRQIGVPVGIGVFFNTMFNVVDTYYAGLISNEALASLSLSFPIYFIIIAVGYGLSIGNTALIGNALGAKNRVQAEQYAVQGVVFGVMLALLITLIGVASSPFLFGFLGASGDYLAMSLSYMNPIFYGTIFLVIVMMMDSVLNAIGRTKPSRNFMVTGFFLNLVLDPWFIFGGFGLPAMGITGIALATILVQALGALYLGYQVAKSGMITVESIRRYGWPQMAVIGQMIRQGLPNMIDLSSVSLGFFLLIFFVSRFGQEAVAAFGAAARIEQVALLPLLALDIATLSLIAQNNGAALPQRVNETLHTAIRYGLIIMAIGGILITLLATPLMDIFSDDPQVIGIGATYIRIKALALLPSAFVFICISTMRGLKKPSHGLLLSMARMFVLPLIGIFIVVELMGFGLLAIWWVTTLITFAVAFIAYFHAKRLLPR